MSILIILLCVINPFEFDSRQKLLLYTTWYKIFKKLIYYVDITKKMTNINFDEASVGIVTADRKAALEVKNNGRRGYGIIGESIAAGGKGVYGKGGEASTGVYGEGKFGFAVFGESTNSCGVVGNGLGVVGVTGQSDTKIAVFGNAHEGAGVYGKSRKWVGVIGESESNAGVWGIGNNMPGVWGDSNNSSGVYGTSDSWVGVQGNSSSSTGVWGVSDTWAGVQGNSNSAAGVYGKSDSWVGVHGESNRIGILGKAPIAGRFEGDVEVTGDIRLKNADCAEDFDVDNSELNNIAAGTVMVLTKNGSLQSSYQEYDKKVAGIVSGASGYKPGIILDRQDLDQNQNNKSKNRLPIALMGKVYCKVDASNSPIEIGDLLTTSSLEGHAMKAEDPYKAFGSVIGKALESLKEGMGMIPVLVALQ